MVIDPEEMLEETYAEYLINSAIDELEDILYELTEDEQKRVEAVIEDLRTAMHILQR